MDWRLEDFSEVLFLCLLRAPNKMTGHSKLLVLSLAASGSIDNAKQKPASPSAPKQKRSFSVLRLILLGTLRIPLGFRTIDENVEVVGLSEGLCGGPILSIQEGLLGRISISNILLRFCRSIKISYILYMGIFSTRKM